MEAVLSQFDLTLHSSIIVFIAIGFVLFYGVLTVLLMSYIFFNRLLLQYRENRDERLIDKYEDQILDILINEQKRTDPRTYRHTLDRLRIAFSGSATRALLKNIVLLNRDMMGDSAILLQELYKDLRLDQRAIDLLKHGSWYQKLVAVKELGSFKIGYAIPQFSDLTESSRTNLRNEAQCALLLLGGPSQLEFLAILDESLTLWQQIRIIRIIKQFDPSSLPDFHIYLTNPNEQVILFVLKLIQIFNQSQAYRAVIDLLYDNRSQVQREAVRTISAWLDQEIVELLKFIFIEGESGVNVCIVRALQQWDYDRDTRIFLEGVVQTSSDYTLRMSSLHALKLLGGEQAIAPLQETLDEVGQRCVVHQLDHRI